MKNSFSLANIGEIISQKYENHSISENDPTPISIDTINTGPINLSGGLIMCNICGNIIRQNYLISHRSSGACLRNAEKRKAYSEKSINKDNSPELYLKHEEEQCQIPRSNDKSYT